MGKIICFYNRKGGVGKTTLSGNFAASLAKEQRKTGGKVLFLDMDPQLNSTKAYLGYPKSEMQRDPNDYPNILNLVGVNAESLGVNIPKKPVKALIQKAPNFGLFTIAGNNKMELYWRKDPLLADDYSAFMEPFEELREIFEYVVIDLPPAQDDMTYSAITASDYLIIPVDSNTASIENFDDFFGEAMGTFTSINPKLKVLGIVDNLYDRFKLSYYETTLKQEAKKRGVYLYKTKISRSSGLEDPNNSDPNCQKSLRIRAGANRSVAFFDKFIKTNYPKAFEDVQAFTVETLDQIKKMEKKK